MSMYQNPKIYNVTMGTANTEYSQLLSDNTRKVLIKLRSGAAALKLSYASGESGSKYMNIPAGSSKYIEGIYLKGLTLYFQSPSASQTAEIEEWAD